MKVTKSEQPPSLDTRNPQFTLQCTTHHSIHEKQRSKEQWGQDSGCGTQGQLPASGPAAWHGSAGGAQEDPVGRTSGRTAPGNASKHSGQCCIRSWGFYAASSLTQRG